jgi:hypothetical protein
VQQKLVSEISDISIATSSSSSSDQYVRISKLCRSIHYNLMNNQSRANFMSNSPLRISEGIYLIRSVADGLVLEAEERKSSHGVHVYLAPSQDGQRHTQLWIITKAIGKEFDYTIRNLSLGTTLGIYRNSFQQGARIVCHAPNGGGNQIWAIYGSQKNNLLAMLSFALSVH